MLVFFLYSNEPLQETVTWNNNAPWWMASSAVGQEKQIDYISQNILSFQGPTALMFALLQGVFVPCDHSVQRANVGGFLKCKISPQGWISIKKSISWFHGVPLVFFVVMVSVVLYTKKIIKNKFFFGFQHLKLK